MPGNDGLGIAAAGVTPRRSPAEGRSSRLWTGRACGRHDRIEPDNFAVGIEVDHETRDNLSGLHARRALEFDIKAVRFRVIVQLHRSSSRKLRVTTRRAILP